MRTPIEVATTQKMYDLMLARFKNSYLQEYIVDLNEVVLYWDDTMTLENGKLGKFRPTGTISLPMYWKEGLAKQTIELKHIMPTLCHELEHYNQYRQYGFILFGLLNNPIWRKWTIEPSALRAEKDAEEILGLNYMEGE